MTNKNPSAFDDLCTELDKDPEFTVEYRRQKPYYDSFLAKQLNLAQNKRGANMTLYLLVGMFALFTGALTFVLYAAFCHDMVALVMGIVVALMVVEVGRQCMTMTCF
jgi:hypothetical protein